MAFPFYIGLGSAGYPGRAGPFPTSSTDRYAIMFGANSTLGVDTLLSAKTVDNGVTWTSIDEAHAPAAQTVYSSVIIGTVIWSLYLDASNVLFAVPFDTASDTWGTPTTSGLTLATGGVPNITSAYRSFDNQIAFTAVNGTITMGSGDTLDTLQFGTFDPVGLSFSTLLTLGYVDISAGSGNRQNMSPRRMIEGSGGVVHCCFMQLNGGGAIPNRLLLQGVTHGGVLGLMVEDIANTILGLTDQAVTVDLGYQPSTGSLFLAYTNFDDGFGVTSTDVVVNSGPSVVDMIFTPAARLATVEVVDSGLAFGVDSSTIDLFYGAERFDPGTGHLFADFYLSVNLAAFALFGSAAESGHVSIGTGMEAVLFTYPLFGLLWQSNYWEGTTPPPPTPATGWLPQYVKRINAA